MSRKDYIKIAAALKSAKPSASQGEIALDLWSQQCVATAKALKEDNPRFLYGKFLIACAVELESVPCL